jgi:pimeloyl-ACP methyl ester carboxylesterase
MIALSAAKPAADFGATARPPLGQLYDIGGRRIALRRSGAGPAVVCLPGAGLIGLDFLNVHDEVARFATAVSYDRGGTGWSDPVRLPRSAASAAAELREALRAASVAPPYVLVAHSLGGAHARRFAQLFPREVAGMVFLDPADAGYLREPPRGLVAQLKMGLAALPALLNAQRFYRPLFEGMFVAWPDALRPMLIDYHLAHWSRSLKEAGNLQPQVLVEIRDGGPLPDAPMIVLTAMGIDPFIAPFVPEVELQAGNVRKRGYYDALAASVPCGENRLVEAGHSTLHTDQPQAVVAAIRDVLARGALIGSGS